MGVRSSFLFCLGSGLVVCLISQAAEIGVLDEYIVRAWHFDKETLEIPADVIRINRQAIDRSLSSSVPDLLSTEANLYFSSLGGSSSVDMRGFGEGSGLRSLILIDGHPLNPADMGRINWEQIPMDAIESVEVLRGGHNVLYGDKALAGVIKIETRRASESSLALEGRAGSFGSSQGSISGGFGGERWGVRAGANRTESDGYRENSASHIRNAYSSIGYTFSNGDDVDVRVATGETELSYPGGLVYEDYRDDPRQSDNLGSEGSVERYTTVNARLNGLRDWGSWELLAGYEYSTADFSPEAGAYGSNQQQGYSLKPRLRIGEDDRVFILGGDLNYDTLDFTRYLDAERTLVPSEASLDESRLSPYFLLEQKVTDALSFSGGARYEWVDYHVDTVVYDESQLSPFIVTNRGTFPNPNYKSSPDILADASFEETLREEGFAAEFSVNYQWDANWSLWAGYDRVYRYPVFDERSSFQGFPLAEHVSEDLEAEAGDNFELGIKYIAPHHELYLTSFYLRMENEIFFDATVVGSNANGKGLNINLGRVDRWGANLFYAYNRSSWGLSYQLAYVDTKMREGEGAGHAVPLVPQLHSVSQLWWNPVEDLRLRLIHRYVGERYQGGDFANEQRSVEAYQLVDFKTEYQVSENCRVFAVVSNVFDQLYAESVFFGNYYPGNGRSIEVGVKLDF